MNLTLFSNAVRTNSLQFELRQFYNKNEIPKVPENNLLLHMKQVTMLLYNGRGAV